MRHSRKKCVWVCTLNEFHNPFLFPPFLDAKIAVQVGWARLRVYLTTTTRQNEEKESIIVIYDFVKVTLQSFSISKHIEKITNFFGVPAWVVVGRSLLVSPNIPTYALQF
jgi:hypothetical protein